MCRLTLWTIVIHLYEKKRRKNNFLSFSWCHLPFISSIQAKKTRQRNLTFVPFFFFFFSTKKKRILTFLLLFLSIISTWFFFFFFSFLFKKNLIKVFHKISRVISRSEGKRERNKTVSLLIDYLTWLLKHVLLRREREKRKVQ